MNSLPKRLLMAAVLAAVLCGCLPTRQSMYADIARSRQQSYRRWAERPEGQELLPVLKGDLTILDALRIALQHNPRVRQALQEALKAKGQLYQAYAEALPRLDLTFDYTRFDRPQFWGGKRGQYALNLTITQPLFKGGAIPTAIQSAKLLELLSDQTLRAAAQEILYATAQAYYDALLAERLVEVQKEALRFAEANLKDVKARYEAGAAIPFDLLRAQVEVSNVKADLVRQQSALDDAYTMLYRTMGVSQQSSVRLTERLNYLPLEPDLKEVVRTALTRRVELYQREVDVRVQRASLRLLYSDYLPDIFAWAQGGWGRPDPRNPLDDVWEDQWMAGLSLSWTLFDGLRREGRILQQKATLRQSELALLDQEMQVLQEVRDALNALRNADELVRSQQKNLERANEALRLVQVGAREGINTPLEVLDARSALTKARGLYYQALHAHCSARLRLQRAMGLLAPPPTARGLPPQPPQPGVVEPSAAEQEHSAAENAPAPGSDNPTEETQ